MALNNPDASSATRQPRAVLKANGAVVENWQSLEVIANSHYVSDTWQARLPLYGQPSSMDFAWWSTETDIEVEIQAGMLQPDGSIGARRTLILGLVDSVDIDPIPRGGEGPCIVLQGRDYSGALIESIVTDIALNETASEVATQIAKEHGLTASVTPTTTPIARYYGDENYGARLTRHESEWDFLTALAQQEGFQVLVLGRTLFFGPPPVPDTANPYVLKVKPPANGGQLQANVKSIRLSRALTVARDVYVYVDSADRMSGAAVHAQYHAVNTIRANRSGNKTPAQRYYFKVPNLTKAQAQQLAEAKAKEITKFERIVEASLPGDPVLTAQSVLRLTGTGTDFDQIYYVDRLEHHISPSRGYEMRLRAKNHSTYSTVPM